MPPRSRSALVLAVVLAGCSAPAPLVDDGHLLASVETVYTIGGGGVDLYGRDASGRAHSFAGTLAIETYYAPPSGEAFVANWSVEVSPELFVPLPEPHYPLDLSERLPANKFYDLYLNATVTKTGATFPSYTALFMRTAGADT